MKSPHREAIKKEDAMEDLDQEYKEQIKKYSLEDLYDISHYIDKERYPTKYKYVLERIYELESAKPVPPPEISAKEISSEINQFNSDEDILNSFNEVSKPSKNIWGNISALLISLILFAALGLFSWKPIDLVILVIVLFVHELGHFISMKLFNYQDVRIFFLPFFGAATSGRILNPNGTKQALISLAGPMPGIVIGFIFALIYTSSTNEIYYRLAILFVSINAFNLLPLHPLDGGHFFESVIFSRHPFIETIFKFITSVILGLIAFSLHAWILLIVAVLMLLTLRIDYSVAKVAYNIRKEIQKGTLANFVLCKESLEIIRDRLGSGIIKSNTSLKAKTAFLFKVWQKIFLSTPRFLISSFLVLVFFLLFIFTIISYSVTIYSKVSKGIDRKIVSIMKNDSCMVWEEIETKDGTLQAKREVDSLNRYDGECVAYYPDGKISAKGYYYHGKWDKCWIHLDQNGDTTTIQVFEKGKFISDKKKGNGIWIERSYTDLSKTEKWSFDIYYKGKGEYSRAKKIKSFNQNDLNKNILLPFPGQ